MDYGEIVQQIVEGTLQQSSPVKNSLNILDDGGPTRITFYSETAIDLAIVSPILEPDLQWAVYPSPLDSDHSPIIITILRQNNEKEITRHNINKTNWNIYKHSVAQRNLPLNITNMLILQI